MSRKGVKKSIKKMSSELWKSKRKAQLQEAANSSEFRTRRAKFLIKQLRRAAKKGKTIAVINLNTYD
jgi:hypothetical protein